MDKITKKLIPFNLHNKNGRIYKKTSFDWDKIIDKELYGTCANTVNSNPNIGEYTNVNFGDVSHCVNNFKLDDDGLYGDIKILDTSNGNTLKTMIDEGINVEFTHRAIGTLGDNGYVTINDIITFDYTIETAFIPLVDIRKHKIDRICKIIEQESNSDE